MDDCGSNLILHLARPSVGQDIPRLVRDLTALRGVRRVGAMSQPPRLLVVEHDRGVIAARTLVARVECAWHAVRVLNARVQSGGRR